MMLKRLRSDNRGAAIIELAIMAPVLAALTIGVVDMSNAFGRKLNLEQAAQRSVEKVMNTTADTTPTQTIIDEASAQAKVDADQIEVEYYLECDGTKSEAETCAEDETSEKWLLVTVNDTYEPMFPVHFAGIGNDGKYHIEASAGMRVQ